MREATGIMPAVRRALVLAIAALAVVPGAAHAATVTLAKVGDFAAPVYVTAPLGDTTRVFVVEKGGTIQVLDGATRSTFLDITSKVDSTDNERGLLSMAFALDYATSGLFYVYYTAKSPVGQVTIEEHRVDPANRDRADPSYARPLVTIPHDQQANHNGGQLQFGPDGLLYAGTGDGGSGGDPSGNAQNTTPAPPTVANGVNHDYRLGKLLRIDPATGAVSIFAYGLRNPWRFSYDRNTGDLVIGDVGQDRYEEVDFAAAPGDGAGANYGWNTYEGLHTYPAGAPAGARPGPSCPSSSTRTAQRARSPAATWSAIPPCRSWRAPICTATTARATISGATLPGGRRARWASRWRTSRASARTAADASTPRRSAGPSTASRAAAPAPGLRPSSAGCPPAWSPRRPTTARPPSPCCAPRRASTRCAQAWSPSACAATSSAR